MTDKERLEEIKEEVESLRGDMSVTSIETETSADIILDDMEWLIEQAERVQELEDIIYQDARQGMIEDLYEENKRYREGIKLAMKKTDCDNTWDFLGRLLEGKEETDLPYRIGYKEESE